MSSVLPRLEKAHVYGTVRTFMLGLFGGFSSTIVRGRIWYILLRYSAQINNCIGNTVCAAEGHHDSRLTSVQDIAIPSLFHAMIHGDIPATIAEQRTSVPCVDERQTGEVVASRYTVKWF